MSRRRPQPVMIFDPPPKFGFMTCPRPPLQRYVLMNERELEDRDAVDIVLCTSRGHQRFYRCHHRGTRRERWEVLRRVNPPQAVSSQL